jgi:hypothetical protein
MRSIIGLVSLGCGLLLACGPTESPPEPQSLRWTGVVKSNPDANCPDDMAHDCSEHAPKPRSLAEARRLLLCTNELASDFNGWTQDPPAQVYAFNVILDQENPISLLDELLADAKPAGKLYAICGLYLLDRERYWNALNRVESEGGILDFRDGDIIWCVGVREAATSMMHDDFPRRLRDAKKRQSSTASTDAG